MKVLTITARFPSLIQPWLVNHLVEIIKNGGENTILCRASDLDVYSDNIDRYKLAECYQVVPRGFSGLFFGVLKHFYSISWCVALGRLTKIIRSGEFSNREKILAIGLLPYFSMQDVDIIHSHSEPAANKLLPLIASLNCPMVVTFHGLPPVGVKPLSNQERQRYLSYAKAILVNTEFAKTQYTSLGADANKVHIIPQGIILEDFPFRVRSCNSERINILTVGRFHVDKGQEYAIRAMALLIRKGFNVRYRLVGNGPNRPVLENLAEELGIADSVEFYSQVSDKKLREIYDASEIFVLPSLKSEDGFHEETQGVVLQEAQAMGLLVIATRVGGIPECIDDQRSGFLVADRSPEAIQDAVLGLLSQPEKWPGYQEAGRRWVEERYNMSKIGEQMKSLYCELIS